MARTARQLVICLDNSGYEVSLERRKIYVSIPDARAAKLGQLRVIDESGEDYLYPQKAFIPAELNQAVRRAVLQSPERERGAPRASSSCGHSHKHPITGKR